jgi:hypothetical protein
LLLFGGDSRKGGQLRLHALVFILSSRFVSSARGPSVFFLSTTTAYSVLFRILWTILCLFLFRSSLFTVRHFLSVLLKIVFSELLCGCFFSFVHICIRPCFFRFCCWSLLGKHFFFGSRSPLHFFCQLLTQDFFRYWLFVQICFALFLLLLYFPTSGLLPTPRHSPQPLFLLSAGSGGRSPRPMSTQLLHSTTHALSRSLPLAADGLLRSKLHIDVPSSKVGLRKQNNLIFFFKKRDRCLYSIATAFVSCRCRWCTHRPMMSASWAIPCPASGCRCSHSPWGLAPCWAAQSSVSPLFFLLILFSTQTMFSRNLTNHVFP